MTRNVTVSGESMVKAYPYSALKFFVITFLLSWISWGCAIYVSWQPSLQHLLLPFILGGIAGPALCTLIMLVQSKNKDLWRDFFKRMSPSSMTGRFVPIALFLFPCQIALAILISLLFGQSLNQFSVITQSSDAALQGIQFLATLLVVFLVGPFEEIGWRYVVDMLGTKYNLLKLSLLFGLIWGLWHVPGFWIKNGAFQEIWDMGLFHTFIYFVDVVLLAIILNWFYVKNNRSILITILFHSSYDMCISVLHITPCTWIILGLVLLATSVVIVTKDKDIFFKGITS